MKNTTKKKGTRKHVADLHEGQVALADAIKEARETTEARKKVTQEHLAEKSLLESESIKRIEKEEGNPQFLTLYPIIRNLGVNPYRIFYHEKYNECPNLMDLVHYIFVNYSDSDAKRAKRVVADLLEMLHSENTKDIE